MPDLFLSRQRMKNRQPCTDTKRPAARLYCYVATAGPELGSLRMVTNFRNNRYQEKDRTNSSSMAFLPFSSR